MPVLIPNETIFSRSVENTTKNGSYIDEILSDSIYCNLRNTFSKKINNKMAKINKKVRIPLKESCISSPITTNALKNRSHAQKKEQKKRRCRIAYRRHTKKDLEAKNMKMKNLIKEGSLDDSLTSLQWLTGVRVNDLMEGRSIHTPPPSPVPSSSSDCNDVDNHWFTSINSENVFDYREIKEVKPPYSYAVLIIMAMKSKPSGKMTLSEIYKWIAENFLFFRNAEPTWQNSIRHNLSLNKCFAKIPRQKGDTGKGGYWTVVAEFANRVLENSIRKRRSNVYSASENLTIRRQRLDLLENQLLINIKAEKELEHDNVRQELPKTLLEDITLTPFKDSITDEVNSLEYYQLDHSYGKSPVVNYNVSDVENIRAIATHLEGTASNFNVCNEDNVLVTSDRNISSTLRTDCVWSTESMSKSTEELLEARRMDSSEHTLLRNIDNSLNNSNGFDSLFYCLSPPLSGDDESYCDDLEDLGSDNTVLCDNDLEYLTVRGTRMKLFDPKTEVDDSLKYDIKSEPLSPISMDLNE